MPDSTERPVFVVVDPAQDRPLALERILKMTRGLGAEFQRPSKIHVFVAVDCDNTDTDASNPAMHRDSVWFTNNIIQPLEASGFDFTLEMSWSSDWYGAIIQRSKQLGAALIMLPLLSNPSEAGRLFNESIWRLMRTALCPVIVVRPNVQIDRSIILAAINVQSHAPEHQRLNDLIISRSQWIARTYDAKLHFVNAYSDSLNYPDRTQLANRTEVNTANIHVVSGEPEVVIADTAKKIGATVVVIGTRSRASRWRGNTAEKIINKVNCDILAIN